MDNEPRIEASSASSPPSPAASGSLWRTFAPLLIVVLLAIATVGAYWNTRTSPFVYDDLHLIQNNPMITENRVEEIFTTEYWAGFERGLIQSQRLYRPLTMWTYALNYQWSAPQGQGRGIFTNWFHDTNTVLHFLTVLLVYAVGFRLFGRRRLIATLGALIFAVHPIHTEAVTRITGRADILAGLFVFLSWWLYIKATETTEKPRPTWLTVTYWTGLLVSFFLGLISKEITVVLLPIVVLYDLVIRHHIHEGLSLRRSMGALFSRRLIGYAGIFAVLMVAMGIRTSVFMQNVEIPADAGIWERIQILADNISPEVSDIAPLDNALIGLSFTERLDDVLHILGYQIGLLVFPLTLSADYSYHQIPISPSFISGSALPWALATLAIFLAGLGLLAFRDHRAKIGFLILFFFVALVPVANFFVLIGTNLGERNLYIASAAVCWGFAWIFGNLWERKSALRYVAAIGIVVVSGLLAYRTVVRNADYSTERRLWVATVEAAPNAPRAHLNLADVYLRSNELSQAEVHAQRASELMPEFVRADLRLGDINMARGQLEEAAVHYTTVIEKLGDRLVYPDGPDAMRKLAQAYIELGNFDEGADAILAFSDKQAWRLFAQMEAAVILSEQAAQTGRLDGLERVRELLEDAARVQIQGGGDNARIIEADLFRLLGYTYRRLEMTERAMAAYLKSLEYDPNQAFPALDLAQCFIEKKQYTRALEYVDRAIELRPDLAKGYLVKAEVYEGWDDFETSLKSYQEALKQGQNERDPRLLFQIGRSFLRWASKFESSDDPMKRSRNREMYAKAQEVLTQGSDLDPDNPKPKLLIAEAYYKLGQLDEAIDTYQGLIARGIPVAHRCHRRLGDFLAELGELEQAEDHYLTAIDLNPRGRNPHLAYLGFLMKQERIEEAREIIDFLMANNRPSEPDSVVEWVRETLFESWEFAQFLFDFYAKTGDDAKADAWNLKVIEIAQAMTSNPDERDLGIEVGCDALNARANWILNSPKDSERYKPREALGMAAEALRTSEGKPVANRPHYRVTFAKAALAANEPKAMGTAMTLIREAKDRLPEDEEIPQIQEQIKTLIQEQQKAAQEKADDAEKKNGEPDDGR